MLNTTAQTNNQPPTLVALPSPVTTSESLFSTTDAITVDYLAIVFETFLDRIFASQGFMLLDQTGSLVQSSPTARSLCRAWQKVAEIQVCQLGSRHQDMALPADIQKLALSLIEGRQLFPELKFQLQDTVLLQENTRINIQAEWIILESQRSSYILVTLENLTEVAHQRALFDAYQYHFTQREIEVWELHLQGLSYRQIAQALFISVNTVKRHMKSIHSKRKDDGI